MLHGPPFKALKQEEITVYYRKNCFNNHLRRKVFAVQYYNYLDDRDVWVLPFPVKKNVLHMFFFLNWTVGFEEGR